MTGELNHHIEDQATIEETGEIVKGIIGTIIHDPNPDRDEGFGRICLEYNAFVMMRSALEAIFPMSKEIDEIRLASNLHNLIDAMRHLEATEQPKPTRWMMIGELKNTGTVEVDGRKCNFNRTNKSTGGAHGFVPIQVMSDGRPVRELNVPAIFYANVKFRTGGHWFRYPSASLKMKKDGQDVD